MTDQSGNRALTHDEFIAEFAEASRRLYGYIRTLVPDRHDADDVYQATSLVMWRKIDEFAKGTNFLAWGCQIARFEVCRLRDSQKRTHILSDEALVALDAELLRQRDDAPQRLLALSECIAKLSPKSQWLIEQRYYRERRPSAIAAELGRSLASVYRALAHTHLWLLTCVENAQQGSI